jgi:hypothetical protein
MRDGINDEEEDLNMNQVIKVQCTRAKNIEPSFAKTISERWWV